jgi:c-di-GMP-binding flagellar brake protein YcgR
MLGKLRKLFNGLTEKNKFDPDEADFAEIALNPNFVTNPSKIIKLLQQVMTAIPLCSVNLNNSTETFYTSILDIQPDDNLLVIDKLSPAYGNNKLLTCGDLKLTALINGVQLSCKLVLINSDKNHEPEHLITTIPKYIYYPQQRASPRIATTPNSVSFKGTIATSNRSVRGYVTDLSRGGISIYCTSLTDVLSRGDTLKDCQIKLSSELLLTFDLSVRTLKKTSNLGQYRQVGGYFHNLSTHDQKMLDRYVSALEREQIRKLRKD